MNRDLLVAVLAILTDAIPRPELAAALKSWTDDRDQSLAQWLKQVGGLDDDRIGALECLATAHLKTHDNDLRLSLYAWNAFAITQDMLNEIPDDGLRSTITMSLGDSLTLPLDGGPQDATAPPVLNPPGTTERGRFRLIRPHARGGIGQVWVARDSELQRDVALKEIQPRFAEREDQRARFMLEAEITGNLEHPGVVPVYSLGRNAEGRPFYAMRFIRGESFSVAIRRFHKSIREEAGAAGTQKRKRPRSMWGIEFRQLLTRFLDVCDAMDYAHSRGVLHRDLKPANIMLGRYGETLVVDWGLAKVIGKEEVIAPQTDGEVEPSLVGASVTLSGETQEGTTIGTPSYMSPEQAKGAIDQLGPASDVYSLGATLYELLTGQVAFPVDKLPAMIDKVTKGEFPPPRTVERSIPVPLEAICLKAMATQPDQRYSSVRALARDIEHWMADEPVAAYPERRHERLGRWLRQHRAWTYAAVAALVGVSLVAIVAATVIEGARRREAIFHQEAETNFIMAQTAVENYLTSVSENTLLKQQDSVDIRSLRRELLNTALKYYKGFVNQRRNDPRLRQQLAGAYFRVGGVTKEIGSPTEAIEAFQSAQTIWEGLTAADPGNHRFRGHLADCHLAIGIQQAVTDDFEAAKASLSKARTLLEPLAVEHPDVATYQASLAECYYEDGIIQGRLKLPDPGLDMLEKAKATQQRLINRYPGQSVYPKKLAEIINSLGVLHFERKDYPAALQSFQEVQSLCQSLLEDVSDGPKPLRILDLLAISYYNIATIELQKGQLDAALQSFERSLEYRAALVDAHPSVTEFQERLGMNLGELAVRQHKAHQDNKASASSRRSIDVLDKLVQMQPDQPRYRSDLARSWNILGYLQDEARENRLAIPAFERAVKEQLRAVADSPDVDHYKEELCNQLDNLGEQYVDLGNVGNALPHYNREIEIWRNLLAAHPENRDYTLKLSDTLSKLGGIQRHGGDSAAAAELFAKARAVLNPTARDDAELQGRRGAILTQEATALADLKRIDEALPLLQQAVDTLSRSGTSPAADDQARESLSESLWELARVLRAVGKPAEADLRDAERSALWKHRPPGELAALALRQSSRAVLIGYGKTPISDPARSVRELDLDQAVASLRLAIFLGFKDLATLRADPDSWILLARADLQPLIKG
ncbi:MAG: protein kinase, partial [Isosphaerales bacterium]